MSHPDCLLIQAMTEYILTVCSCKPWLSGRPWALVGSLYTKAVDIAEEVNDYFAYTY